jgi:hypothetical protein
MKVQITQETFDAAVAENIELLEMSPEEAVAEAVKQFEAQVCLITWHSLDISPLKLSVNLGELLIWRFIAFVNL